jgi:hypothetical protein
MPITMEFLKDNRPIGKVLHVDGEYSHFVWRSGRADAESVTNLKVHNNYKTRNEEYVPLEFTERWMQLTGISAYQMELVLKPVLCRRFNGIEQKMIFHLSRRLTYQAREQGKTNKEKVE